MSDRPSGISWSFFVLVTLVVLGGAWLYANWQASQSVLPPGMSINEYPVGGMTREQTLEAIAQAYTTPITVYYRSEISLLQPEMVELSLDVTVTQENLDEVLAEQSQAQGFISYILDLVLRREPERQRVSAVVTYSRERADAFLERMARKHDHPPMASVPLPEAGTFRPAQPGTELDVEASLPLLIKAILSPIPKERQVHLVVHTEPPPNTSLDLLHEAISTALSGFPGVAGVFIKDLETGQELCINCNVAFSGMDLLKLAVVMERYRGLDQPPNATTEELIAAILTGEEVAPVDALLAQLGAGDAMEGTAQVTGFLQSLGLQSSFIAAPYGERDPEHPPPEIATTANSNAAFFTEPDPYMQTTPMEIGLLLEGVYQCDAGGGFLRVLYPQKITPGECQSVLAWMRSGSEDSLLAAGLPAGTPIAAEHGWQGATHAEAALLYTPQRDLMVAAFFYQPNWLVWEDAAPTFATVGQLTYRFYNGNE